MADLAAAREAQMRSKLVAQATMAQVEQTEFMRVLTVNQEKEEQQRSQVRHWRIRVLLPDQVFAGQPTCCLAQLRYNAPGSMLLYVWTSAASWMNWLDLQGCLCWVLVRYLVSQSSVLGNPQAHSAVPAGPLTVCCCPVWPCLFLRRLLRSTRSARRTSATCWARSRRMRRPSARSAPHTWRRAKRSARCSSRKRRHWRR